MDVKVNSVNFTADQKLVRFVNEKVNKLTLFFDNIIVGEVFLKVDHDQERINKVAEVKLLIPG